MAIRIHERYSRIRGPGRRWAMGCSTRLDVKLRAYVPGEDRRPGWQEFTDLDVLGVGLAPGGRLHLTIADCKTANRRAIERMFWVRGVADFFDANEAYLVRSHSVPAAARALSNRLGVGVLDPDDLQQLLATFPVGTDFDGPLSCLFDMESVRRQADNVVDLDKRLKSLVDYIRFDYWIYEPYRNLTQTVAHLAEVVGTLDPTNPSHRSIFFETAWLYGYALAQAVHHVRKAHIADVPASTRTYVAGGELALREKGRLARLLNDAGIGVDPKAAVLPPYVESLTELLTRLLVRPNELSEVLRYSEYLSAAAVVGENATIGQVFGMNVHPFAAKLLLDICGFLVFAAGLRPDFRALARASLVVDLTGGKPDNVSDKGLSIEKDESPKRPDDDGHLPLVYVSPE